MYEILPTFSDENLSILEKNNLLKQLIKSEFIQLQIDDIFISANDLDEEINKIKTKNSILKDEDFNKYLALNKLDISSFKTKVQYQLKINNLSSGKFSNKCEARFLQRRYLLDQVTYSLLRVDSFYQARELKIRILENEENFSEIAIKHSKGFESKNGGVIGPTSLINAHPALIDILRTSKTGELTGPVKIDKWFVVVRVENFKPAKLDEETQLQMAQELLEEWINKEVNEIHNAIIERINPLSSTGLNS
tara:strand:+ start:150 stop:899 length:750 start_codon:yes stop_codon:yes gene_type:complete